MLLSVLLLALETATPDPGLPEYLNPEAGLAQLFPGAFAELLSTPDSVTVTGLAQRDDLLRESDVRFVAGWSTALFGTQRDAVLEFVGKGTSYRVMNPARCGRERCLFTMFCGGFNPSLEVLLKKGPRRARLRVCFGCGELWVTHFEGKKKVADEQAMVEDQTGWMATFTPLLPRPRQKK